MTLKPTKFPFIYLWSPGFLPLVGSIEMASLCHLAYHNITIHSREILSLSHYGIYVLEIFRLLQPGEFVQGNPHTIIQDVFLCLPPHVPWIILKDIKMMDGECGGGDFRPKGAFCPFRWCHSQWAWEMSQASVIYKGGPTKCPLQLEIVHVEPDVKGQASVI